MEFLFGIEAPMIEYLALFFVGSCVGSFLNVVIYRVPRGESIVKPPSHCPRCNKFIKPWENVPIFSFIFLGGKCSNCKLPISWQYPLIEAITGLSLVILLYRFGWSKELLIYGVLSAHLIALSVIDIQVYRLPNPIVLSGAIFALILNIVFRPDVWLEMILGGLIGIGFLMIVGLLGNLITRKETLGMGDVKLAGMIGITVGIWHTLGMFAFGYFLGAIIGGIMLLIGAKTMSNKLPFGPYLSIGVFISLLWGSELWRFYTNLVFA